MALVGHVFGWDFRQIAAMPLWARGVYLALAEQFMQVTTGGGAVSGSDAATRDFLLNG